MPVLVWGGVECFPAHSYYYYYLFSLFFFFFIIIILLLLLSLLLYCFITIGIMATSASLFIEALSNLLYIVVVTYLCIKGWWLLVNKVVHAVHYLVACTHIGYGRLTHSFLSAIFLFLAVPDLLHTHCIMYLFLQSSLVTTVRPNLHKSLCCIQVGAVKLQNSWRLYIIYCSHVFQSLKLATVL